MTLIQKAEEQFCTCGAGHGSLEGHAGECHWPKLAPTFEANRSAFAWLIEAPGQHYLGTRTIGTGSPEFFWTKDHARATRFFSEEQADGVMEAVRKLNPGLWGFALTLGEARPVEHSWIND